MKKIFASKKVLFVAIAVALLLAGLVGIVVGYNAGYKTGYNAGALAEKAEWQPAVEELSTKLAAVTTDPEETVEAPIAKAETKVETKINAACTIVDINSATQEELESLPGVGPSMAGKIIAARPIADSVALDAISGVGEKLLAKLLPCVKF